MLSKSMHLLGDMAHKVLGPYATSPGRSNKPKRFPINKEKLCLKWTERRSLVAPSAHSVERLCSP